MTSVHLPFDRHPIPNARLDALDLDLVAQTIKRGYELGRYRGPEDPELYLDRFGGTIGEGAALRPTVAGVLAFAAEPERWLTASGIDIAIYRGEQALPTRARVEQIRGPVFQMIDNAVAVLQEACTYGRLEGARLINELDTPLVVLRELTTNAVVHRDLSVFGSQVRIQIFPRTIEWSSPGGLPHTITIATLLTAQFSRNPSLAQFLFHAGYIEKFGMGLDAVIDALDAAHLGLPGFYDDGHSFRVRVARASGTEEALPDGQSREDRLDALRALFTEHPAWRQRDLLLRLGGARSTLQRDLEALVRTGELTVSGATRNRVYALPPAQRDE